MKELTQIIQKSEFLERLSLLSANGQVYQKKIGFTVKKKQVSSSKKGYGEIVEFNSNELRFCFQGEYMSVSLQNKDFECRVLNTNIIHLFDVKTSELEVQFTIM